MMRFFTNVDLVIFVIYFVLVAGYGYWIYNKKKKAHTADTHDYFLAEGSLTWWAIGASLIASNISAEQFIGMSGEGFFVGIAVAAYEWIAAFCADHHCGLVHAGVPEEQDLIPCRSF